MTALKTIVSERSLCIFGSNPAQISGKDPYVTLLKVAVGSFNVQLRGTLKPSLICLFGVWGVSDLTWSLKAGRPRANDEEPRAVRCD